jgi:hypothetical protein
MGATQLCSRPQVTIEATGSARAPASYIVTLPEQLVGRFQGGHEVPCRAATGHLERLDDEPCCIGEEHIDQRA